jgi:hypothetical protein
MEVRMRFIVGLVVICAAVPTLHAQDLTAVGHDSGSLGAPSTRPPEPLTRVFVQPMNIPEEWAGYLLNLGPNTLTLVIDGHRVEFPLEQVRRIQIPGDRVRDGARIGALVGGLWCVFVCHRGLEGGNQWPAAVALTAGMGAAIGVGIDAAIPGRTTIYRRSTTTSSPTTAVRAPVLLRFRF